MEQFDLAILSFFTSFAGKSPVFDHIVNAISRFDLFKGVVMMCLFWFLWASDSPSETPREQDERHEKLVNVLIGTLLTVALSRALQIVLHVHKRPLLSDLPLHFPVLETGWENLNAWNSFPSDHSMLFFAFGTGIWTINRRAGLFALLWSFVMIDLPRIYLGIHYPSDVIGGAILGTVCMLGFLRLPIWRLSHRLNEWRHRHRGVFIAAMFFVTDQLAHLLAEFRDLAASAGKILFHGH